MQLIVPLAPTANCWGKQGKRMALTVTHGVKPRVQSMVAHGTSTMATSASELNEKPETGGSAASANRKRLERHSSPVQRPSLELDANYYEFLRSY